MYHNCHLFCLIFHNHDGILPNMLVVLFFQLIDGLLSIVEQSPSESMLDALQPLMKALAVKEFLRHSNMDVKVAVASCISEITRITAPEAPYDDDIMKVCSNFFVNSFKRHQRMI